MLLDAGICTVCQVVDGDTARGDLVTVTQSWYGNLDYSSSPFGSEYRVDVSTHRRIRVHRMDGLNGLNAVQICGKRYEVTRIYNGVDPDNGQQITDLTLRLIETKVSKC